MKKIHRFETTVFYFLGELVILLTALLLIPFCVCFYYQESFDQLLDSGSEPEAFGKTILISALVGFLLRSFTRPRPKDLKPRDGFLIVTLSWILMSAIGALPFYFYKEGLSYTDAFFETMSGFTTTGASVMTNIELFPKGILFWRAFTQWLGGMGIIVLSLALLPSLGVVGYQLFQAEVPGPTTDKIVPRIRDTAKYLWKIYALISAVEVLLLCFGGMSLYDALCHTFATMSTGGFSTKNASVAYFREQGAFIEWVLILFMFLGGINFILYYHLLFRLTPRPLLRNEEFQVYSLIVLFGTVFICSVLYWTPVENFHGHTLDANYQKDPEYKIFSEKLWRDGFFTSITILTTTGFGTEDFNKWPDVLRLFLLGLMIIGGCAGSTGGGLKVIRALTLFKIAWRQPKTLIKPNAVFLVKVNQNTVDNHILYSIGAFFVLYVLIHLFFCLVVVALGVEFVTGISAVISAINNIGPGLNVIGPAGNYALLSDSVKWVLSFCMLLGRLEIYSVIVLFFPYTWKK